MKCCTRTMMNMPRAVVFLLCPLLNMASIPPSSSDQQVAMGQSKYTELSQASQMPRYGQCWMAALARLPSTCDQLTDETHSRLALQFTNCLLAQSGQKTYECREEEDIASCLEGVDNNAWTSYSNFYTHTHNMCYFLKSQQWKELTDKTINRLSDTSAEAVEKLEQSQKLQEQIADGQQQSLEYHRQLVENGSVLSQAIEASRGSVKDMMEEFKLSTLEQRNMIFEVFDRVSRLQNLVVSEVSWLYTVVFYCFSLLVIYLVTATRRTADARLWLFLFLTINFGMERLIVKLSLPDEVSSRTAGNTDVALNDITNERVWILRNTTVLISFLTLVWMAVRFKDYNLINNKLLEDIQKQNLELKRSMENFKVDNRDSFHLSRSYYDNLDGAGHNKILEMLGEDTGFQGDEEEDNEYDDSDSDDSWNSTMSSRTVKTRDDRSREVTPTPDYDINIAVENLEGFNVMSTPLKSVSDFLASTSRTSQRSGSRLSTSSVVSNYNTRSKSRASMSSNTSLLQSPETPVKDEDINKFKNIANRNTTKLKMLQKNLESPRRSETPEKKRGRGRPRKTVQNNLNDFSADEDAL